MEIVLSLMLIHLYKGRSLFKYRKENGEVIVRRKSVSKVILGIFQKPAAKKAMGYSVSLLTFKGVVGS